jgi:hypothetical protein
VLTVSGIGERGSVIGDRVSGTGERESGSKLTAHSLFSVCGFLALFILGKSGKSEAIGVVSLQLTAYSYRINLLTSSFW